jgi:hypothetical protein
MDSEPTPSAGSDVSLRLPEQASALEGAVEGLIEEASAEVAGEVRLRLEVISGMTDSARACYRQCIQKFAKLLANEASRIELGDRAPDADKPEITTSMVYKASDSILNPPAGETRPSLKILISQFVAFVGAILTPICGAYLHSRYQWTATIICGIIAVGSELYSLVRLMRK